MIQTEMAAIKIPQLALKRFILEAKKNLIDNDIVETLSYFLGDENEDEINVETVLFPDQSATQSRVNDEGKFAYIPCLKSMSRVHV